MFNILDRFGNKIGSLEPASGGGLGILGIFIFLIMLAFICFPFVAIAFMPEMFGNLSKLDEGDPFAVESLCVISSSIISWIISAIRIIRKNLTFKEKMKDVPRSVFKMNFIIMYIVLITVDIIFIERNIFHIIIGLIFGVVLCASWAFVFSFIGIIIVGFTCLLAEKLKSRKNET